MTAIYRDYTKWGLGNTSPKKPTKFKVKHGTNGPVNAHQICGPSIITKHTNEAGWPSGRASDSGARGWGFDPHSDARVVSLNKIHLPPKTYCLYPGSGGSIPT